MKSDYIHNIKHALIFVAMFSIATFCTACVTQNTREDGSVAKSDGDSERECRTYGTTGTKMKRSICRSKEEWAVVDAREQELESEQERETNSFFRRTSESSSLITGDGLDNPNAPPP